MVNWFNHLIIKYTLKLSISHQLLHQYPSPNCQYLPPELPKNHAGSFCSYSGPLFILLPLGKGIFSNTNLITLPRPILSLKTSGGFSVAHRTKANSSVSHGLASAHLCVCICPSLPLLFLSHLGLFPVLSMC